MTQIIYDKLVLTIQTHLELLPDLVLLAMEGHSVSLQVLTKHLEPVVQDTIVLQILSLKIMMIVLQVVLEVIEM